MIDAVPPLISSKNLAENNNREWFTENRKRYDSGQKRSREALVKDLAQRR
jgi:uncharacterized protein (DUF2461 family)